MWNNNKQQRLDSLRQQAQHGPLVPEDMRELDQLILELEQAEWVAMRPALQHLRQEQSDLSMALGQLELQNSILGALTERYADLLARAQGQLQSLAREHDVLHQEYTRTLQDVAPR